MHSTPALASAAWVRVQVRFRCNGPELQAYSGHLTSTTAHQYLKG